MTIPVNAHSRTATRNLASLESGILFCTLEFQISKTNAIPAFQRIVGPSATRMQLRKARSDKAS
jgi:hypothetical protein